MLTISSVCPPGPGGGVSPLSLIISPPPLVNTLIPPLLRRPLLVVFPLPFLWLPSSDLLVPPPSSLEDFSSHLHNLHTMTLTLISAHIFLGGFTAHTDDLSNTLPLSSLVASYSLVTFSSTLPYHNLVSP